MEIDFDKALVAAVLREGYPAYLDQPISNEMLSESGKLVMDFVANFYEQHKTTPSVKNIEQMTEASFDDMPLDPLSYWVSLIRKRTKHQVLTGAIDRAMSIVGQDPDKAEEILKSAMADFEALIPFSGQLTPVFNLEIWQAEYEKAQLGIQGIETPWPTLTEMTQGWRGGELTFIAARPGVGKCHDPETILIRADGALCKVKDLCVGDELLGPDSLPRRILSVCEGEEEMFEVTPVKGEPWRCNKSHILSLKISSGWGEYKSGQIVNMSIDDYLNMGEKFRHQAKLYRVAVDFPLKYTGIDPYLLGLWLGDGTFIYPSISNSKPIIAEYLLEESGRIGEPLRVTKDRTTITHAFLKSSRPAQEFRKCRRKGEKRIPSDYLVNDREKRLRLLAGLIDTDGYVTRRGCEIISKYRGLADDIAFLSRSLGFGVSVSPKKGTIKSLGFIGDYWRVFIYGDLSVIPTIAKFGFPRRQIKNVLHTGFSLKSLGLGKYRGFTLDRDHLYLLRDFTVTHNTFLLLHLLIHAWKKGKRVLCCSTEMSVESLVMRTASLATKTSYERHRKGRLTSFEQKFVSESMQAAKDDETRNNFLIMGDGFDVFLETIEAKINIFKPDIVAIDGGYLLKSKKINERDRLNRIAELFNQFKSLAKRHGVPVLITTQLNRAPSSGMGKEKKVGLERMAFSDNAGMVADNVFVIEQEKKDKDENRIRVIPLKLREGSSFDEIGINWNFETQEFHEVDLGSQWDEDDDDPDPEPKKNKISKYGRPPKGVMSLAPPVED